MEAENFSTPLLRMGESRKAAGWASKKASANASLADRVYAELKKHILSGDIPARTRLVETDIAERFGASRTPVREAISRLIRDQFVVPLAYGGVEVVDTSAELDKMYVLRIALEGVATRMAAHNIQQEELARLQEIVDSYETISYADYEQRVALNTEFHNLIITACRYERLISLIEDYREIFLNLKIVGKYSQRDSRLAMSQHRDIVEALQARDGLRAEQAMRQHLEYGREMALKQSHQEGP